MNVYLNQSFWNNNDNSQYEYCLVYSYDHETFSSEYNDKLFNGWKPVGDYRIICVKGNSSGLFLVQSFYKEVKIENKNTEIEESNMQLISGSISRDFISVKGEK